MPAQTNQDQEDKVKVPAHLIIGKVVLYALYAWVLFGIITLGLRVFLLAFSANPTTPFVEFIYNTSANFLQPFRGIFPPKPVSETGYIDVTSMFAMIIYGFIAWGFSALLEYVKNRITVTTVEQEAEIAEKKQRARATTTSRSNNNGSTTSRNRNVQ